MARLAAHLLVCWLGLLISRTGVSQDVEQDESLRQLQGSSRCYDDENQAQRCIPEFVNAAFTRVVEATNTCGDPPIEFCMQTGVTGSKEFCDMCNARNASLSHPPSYLTDFNNNDNLTWWQSKTMYQDVQYPNEVNLTLHLGKAFDITYVRLKFHSPRPESFAIYKRTNEDGPWIPYQYYSSTCRDTYSLPDGNYIRRGDETQALCTSEYSDISPLTGGNVAFSTLEGRPSAYEFDNSPELQEWVAATDIRIVLDRINTFGDEVFGDPKVLQSYYYAISDFAVGGRCKCNGHASECVRSPAARDRLVCRCEHNTAGPDCNECLPFYNDQPWGRATSNNAHECKPCNCNGRSNRCYFDKALYDRTGHGGHCLDCQGSTDGPNCERCQENFYERGDGVCISCNCDKIGSRNLQCDTQGKCQCKPGVTGEKCDRCEVNHYDFGQYGCRPCGCNEAGSVGNKPSCDAISGVCRCKENVEGQRCDSCKPGYFNLDSDDGLGCTPCFCYGHSSVCRSAPGYSKISLDSSFTRDRERWVAVDQNGQAVPTQYNAIIQNVAVSAPGRETVYFSAPEKFTGDQRASYNQLLSFTFRINSSEPRAAIEDLVIERGRVRVSLPIFSQGNPLPSYFDQTYKFKLHEHPDYGWAPRLNSHEYISLLSNITALKIRATYSPGGVGFLDTVSLASAQRAGTGREARWVEMCTCPDGYVGQFCESCAPGFRHDPPHGGHFARCVLCDCHGHADICDSETGRCICRHNTAGETCDRCARGYYGNALLGTPDDCKACPCPNQGACVQLQNSVMCIDCPAGYTGSLCELCTDGYFGDPQGQYGNSRPCQRCDCSGNIDLNAVGNCNRTTGECLKCILHTAGRQCEHCLPGFYGDALVLPKGDCRPCNCHSVGSDGRTCHPVTGQCQCKQHVTGLRCDRCEEGFWELVGGSGCRSCNCDPIGSEGQACDINTGQCTCRPKVTGLLCDRCAPYHYGFSTQGCRACECDTIGSRSPQCDDYGQCECMPNVEGKRCDRCKENKYNKTLGCIDCPPCYNLVQASANDLRGKLDDLRRLLKGLEENPEIDDVDFEQKLREVMLRVDEILKAAEDTQGEEGDLVERLAALKKRIDEVRTTTGRIEGEISAADQDANRGIRNITLAEEAIARAKEALESARKYLETEGREALLKAQERADKFGQQSERMSQIAREARQEADRQEKDAQEIENIAKEAHNTSSEAYRVAREAIDQQRETNEEIRKLRQDLKGTDDLMEHTKRQSNEALAKANETYNEALDIYTDAKSLTLPEVDVPKMVDDAAEIKEEAKKIQAEADDLMNRHSGLLDDLENQKSEAENLLARGMEQQQVADMLLADADAAHNKALTAVEMGEKTLKEANNTLEILKEFDRRVQESKLKADEALKLVPEIMRLIEEAETKARQARDSLSGAESDAALARELALEAQRIAEQASKDADAIREEAGKTKERAAALKTAADGLAAEVADAAERLKNLQNQAAQDQEAAKEALEKANEAKISAQDADGQVKGALKTVDEILNTLNNLAPVDKKKLEELERRLKEVKQELEKANVKKRLEDLRQARIIQSKWLKDYTAEMIILRANVKNAQEIREALPEGCFKTIVLEPTG